MAKIIFFCRASTSAIKQNEFYRQDILALEALGHEVRICTRWSDLLLSRWDLVFIWWWTYAFFPVILAQLIRKRSIITGTFNFKHPQYFKGGDYFSRPMWQRLLIVISLRLTNLNLFVSSMELEECKNYFGIETGRLFPHILPETYLQGLTENRSLAILNIAWRGKSNLVRKGIPDLLGAIKILKRRGVNAVAYLVGRDGDGCDYLNKLIETSGLQDNVFNLGEVSFEKKQELLRGCEIYAQPSHYEGFGVAISEAMGAGACIITCDVGAVKEVVGDAGIYAKPGDCYSIARSILRIMYDGDLRTYFQNKSFERARRLGKFEDKTKALQQYLAELGIH